MSYLILANEDSFSNEKYPEFVTPSTLLTTKTTPPAGAVQFRDWIDLVFTDGDFGDRGSDTETVKTSCGSIDTTNYNASREPNMTVEMDFKRLGYVLGRFQNFYSLASGSDSTNPSAADNNFLVAGNDGHEGKSDTIYLKQYSDAEYVNTGFQISELSYDISDKGIIEFTLNGVSSYERLGIDRDKNYGVCTDLILKTDNIVNVYIRELTSTFTPGVDDDLTLYEEIGCSLNSLGLSLTNSLSEDSFSPCGLFQGGKPVLKSGKKSIESKENTFTSESKQTNSHWLRLYFGGKGSVDYVLSKRFVIVIVYQNQNGQLRQILPNCKIVPSTPSMSVEDPTEELNIIPGFGSLNYTGPGTGSAAAKQLNTDIATYYQTQSTTMASIAYAQIGNLSGTATTGLGGKKLTIRSGTNLQQYYVFKTDSDSLLIPLYTGTYSLYQLTDSGETKKGSDFTLTTSHTETSPLNLTTQFLATTPNEPEE